MTKKLIIYGAGDFAAHCTKIFESEGRFQVVAYAVDKEFQYSDEFNGRELVSFNDITRKYPPTDYSMFVAVGYRSMRVREKLYKNAISKGYSLFTYVSDKAIVSSSVKIGSNNIIMDGVIIEHGVLIGNNNIFWSGVTICHDTKIENHSFFASSCTVGGESHIKNMCFLGFNSVVIQKIKLENETLVAACSLVLKNSDQFSKLIGQPAKVVGTHADIGIKIG